MKFAHLLLLFTALSVTYPAISHAKPASPLAGKKRDQRTPIEVSADALEVLQEESKAIFSGHVVAIQGDLRLTAESMTVYYNPDAQKAEGKKTDQNAIKKIDAIGSVFLATPEETASGTHGVYDVVAQEIRLTGKVVLTRGKNVLEGEALTYNFATGKSKIVSAAADTGAKTKTGEKPKRVRALFVPDDKKEKPE